MRIFEAANGVTLHDLPASSDPSNSTLGQITTPHTQSKRLTCACASAVAEASPDICACAMACAAAEGLPFTRACARACAAAEVSAATCLGLHT